MGFIDLFPLFSKKDATKELGNSGLEAFSGFINNDYNSDWRDDKRIETVLKMRNDGQVAAVLRAVKMPIINIDWFLVVQDENDELQKKHLEFVKKYLFENNNFKRILIQALVMLDFGFMYFEKVWKIEDGVLVLNKLAPRLASAHYKWEMENGEAGVTQLISSSLVKTSQFSIPNYKLSLFTFDSEGDDPSGIPLIRAAYIHWKMKNLLYKIEMVANERFRAGIPMAHYVDQTVKSKLVDFLKNIISNQKAFGAFQGRLDPNSNEVKENVKFSFLTAPTSGEAKSSMDNIIHHNRMIAQSILAQHISLGETNGTQALGQSFSKDFKLLLLYVIEHLIWPLNHLIKEMEYNGFSDGQNFVKLAHGDIEDKNIKEYVESLKLAIEGSLLDVEPKLKKQVRATFKLPILSEEEEEEIKSPIEKPKEDKEDVVEEPEKKDEGDEDDIEKEGKKEDEEISEEEKFAELDDVFTKYKNTINMSANELQAWSETECSKLASLDRSPIQRNLRLLNKKKEDWNAQDIRDASRTISFVNRMKANLGGENIIKDSNGKTCGTKAYISLKNWAYDDRKGKASEDFDFVCTLGIPKNKTNGNLENLKKKDIEQLEELSKWDKKAQKDLNRVLTLAEKKIDFDAIQEYLDRNEKELASELEELTAQQKTLFFSKLEKALYNEDVKAINEQSTQLTNKMKTIIKTAALAALAFGKKNSAKELKTNEPTTPNLYPQTINGEIDDLLAKRGQNIDSDVKSSIRESLLKGIGAVAAIAVAKDIFDKKAKEGNQSIIGYIPIENINRGRDIVYDTFRNDFYAIQRSEILDNKVCNFCMSIDGRIMKPSDPFAKMGAVHQNCFIAGSRVLTAQGSKVIEDIEVDDIVATHLDNWKGVYHTMSRYYEGELLQITLEDNTMIQCTPEHKFWINDEWREAKNLIIGDVLTESLLGV